ncbi:MAG: Cupin domain protein [Parcubacteria group bacterium ADurb.Bin247]|jgi:mannose-6-phosphate isomerase-like protein (cupin superfamily)|nr:MAG: Cupin domain protein [Parcubacteria group bacterium ADurb.Bin247]HQB18851.1 cupin domain-containing protein [Candidatus Pacearchaeota archaeon]
MKGYIANIEEVTKENNNFRKVLYTGKNSQLVVMSINPGEEIGAEVHKLDQFIRIEEGEGSVILDGVEHVIKDGYAVVIPAGTNHNVLNSSNKVMKLYSIYSPAEHKDGIIHVTKTDALNDHDDHFDGKTTE